MSQKMVSGARARVNNFYYLMKKNATADNYEGHKFISIVKK